MLICKLVFAVKQALIILTCSHYVSQTTVVGNVALNKEADLCLENCSEPAAHPWSVSRQPGLCVDTQVGRATSASISESLPAEISDNRRKLLGGSSDVTSLLFQEPRMKRRASDRGAGETSAKAKALCAGISGNNAKRAGPFILGKQGGGSALGKLAAGGKTENKRHCGMRESRRVTQCFT